MACEHSRHCRSKPAPETPHRRRPRQRVPHANSSAMPAIGTNSRMTEEEMREAIRARAAQTVGPDIDDGWVELINNVIRNKAPETN